MKYRQEGRPIIYTDVSYVDSSHASAKSWSDGSTQGLKKPISKGQRVVIVHAGSGDGFVPNALLLFKDGTKSGDYHDNINFVNYDKWLRTRLLPNLLANSVLVVDNASYHNKQADPAPSANSKKAEMVKWLQDKGIQFNDNMLKSQLFKLIKLNKEQHKKYSIDNILSEHGHSVLRLPPYHPNLNLIEMAWAAIKGYVAYYVDACYVDDPDDESDQDSDEEEETGSSSASADPTLSLHHVEPSASTSSQFDIIEGIFCPASGLKYTS